MVVRYRCPNYATDQWLQPDAEVKLASAGGSEPPSAPNYVSNNPASVVGRVCFHSGPRGSGPSVTQIVVTPQAAGGEAAVSLGRRVHRVRQLV